MDRPNRRFGRARPGHRSRLGCRAYLCCRVRPGRRARSRHPTSLGCWAVRVLGLIRVVKTVNVVRPV